jgi:uncharacterized protein YegL
VEIVFHKKLFVLLMYFILSKKQILSRGVILHGLFLFVFTINALAQRPSDFFKTTENNYGALENGATLLSVFTFTNPGAKNLYILSAKGSRAVTLEFSRRAVATGATDSVVVRYTPSAKGPFKESVEVILSALDKPVKLEISGNIKNYNQDFLTSCFRFGSSNTPGVFRFEHTGTVIDAVTGKPIVGATIQLVDIGGIRGDLKSNRSGTYSKEVTPGLYEFVVTAPNYIGVYHEQYINPQKPDVTFKLEPLKPEEILVVNTPVQEPEPIGEIPAPGTTTPIPPVKPTKPTPPTPPALIKPVAKEGELSYDEYRPNNVVFLIDVSGSMKDSLKLPLLKQSMINLLGTLRPIDRLAIVTYADGANIVLSSTPVTDKARIQGIIDGLTAAGKTEGGKGMKKAYRVAESNFIPGGNNQIILATDGAFSSLGEEEGELSRLIDTGVRDGISLSILGFGNKKYALETMQKFAKQGNGSYHTILTKEDSQGVLVDEIKSRSKK